MFTGTEALDVHLDAAARSRRGTGESADCFLIGRLEEFLCGYLKAKEAHSLRILTSKQVVVGRLDRVFSSRIKNGFLVDGSSGEVEEERECAVRRLKRQQAQKENKTLISE